MMCSESRRSTWSIQAARWRTPTHQQVPQATVEASNNEARDMDVPPHWRCLKRPDRCSRAHCCEALSVGGCSCDTLTKPMEVSASETGDGAGTRAVHASERHADLSA